MDLEELTKTQIILLTLLISFVTSIATGIVTVTLLDQAPPAVTQTINRVVERTVERIVPDKTQGASVITKTVVVKENDLITTTIEQNSKNLVRISMRAKGADLNSFAGLGVIVSSDGIVATDSSLLIEGFVYTGKLSDGSIYDLEIVEEDGGPTALLKIVQEEDENIEFSSAKISSDLSVLKLGQSVIALGGKNRTNVSLGIVSGLIEKDIEVPSDTEDEETKIVTLLSFVETNISEQSVLPGSPLIDIFGDIVGISTASSRDGGGADYTPIHTVEAQMSELSVVDSSEESNI